YSSIGRCKVIYSLSTSKLICSIKYREDSKLMSHTTFIIINYILSFFLYCVYRQQLNMIKLVTSSLKGVYHARSKSTYGYQEIYYADPSSYINSKLCSSIYWDCQCHAFF